MAAKLRHDATGLVETDDVELTTSGSPYYAFINEDGGTEVSLDPHIQEGNDVGVSSPMDAITGQPATLESETPGLTRWAWPYDGAQQSKRWDGTDDPANAAGLSPTDGGGAKNDYNFGKNLVLRPSPGSIRAYAVGDRGSSVAVFSRPPTGFSGPYFFIQGGAQDRVACLLRNAAGSTILTLEVSQPTAEPQLRMDLSYDDAVPGSGTGTLTLRVWRMDTDELVGTDAGTYTVADVDWSNVMEVGRNTGDNVNLANEGVVIETYDGDIINGTATRAESIQGSRSGAHLPAKPDEYLAASTGGVGMPVAFRLILTTGNSRGLIIGQSLGDGTLTGQDPTPSKAVAAGATFYDHRDSALAQSNYGARSRCAYETVARQTRTIHKWCQGGITMEALLAALPAVIASIQSVADVDHRGVDWIFWPHGQQDARSADGDWAGYRTRFDTAMGLIIAAFGTPKAMLIPQLSVELESLPVGLGVWDRVDEMNGVFDDIVTDYAWIHSMASDPARYIKQTDSPHETRVGSDFKTQDLDAFLIARGL